MNVIASATNDKIKQIVKLANSKILRYELNLAVIYGRHLIQEALQHELLHSVFIVDTQYAQYAALLHNFYTDSIYLVREAVFTKINIADSPVAIVGLMRISTSTIHDTIYEKDCIILDNIQDPGNLGTILRSSAACAITNIILSKSCVDPYNPKVLRASQGIQFGLNIMTAVDVAKFVANYKYKLIATMPRAVESIYEYDFIQPCAWLFGNEGSGISQSLLDAPQIRQLSIPCKTESLNVAMAATVCLFEMCRQRAKSNPTYLRSTTQ